MIRPRTIGSVAVLGIAVMALWSLSAGADQRAKEPRQPEPKASESKQTEKREAEEGEAEEDRSHFMRLKLEASMKVLEGLATEDFGLIKEGAEKLNTMSTAEKWRVTNDALYRNFSGDFQRVTKDLIKAAEDENLDRAALKWMDATMSCIECHRYARGIMVASNLHSPVRSQREASR